MQLVEALLELLEREAAGLVVRAQLVADARPVAIRDEDVVRWRHVRKLAPAPPERRPFTVTTCLIAEHLRGGCEIVGLQRHQVVTRQARERVAADPGEAKRLRVQRLLEKRPREARIAEALVPSRTRQDRTDGDVSPFGEDVLVVARERARDRQKLVGRVVGEGDLAREARAESGIRVEEAVHQLRVAGDDHDEPVAVVLHPLQQRLDRLGPEVLPLVAPVERVGLVDEEDAVERAADDAVGLERSRAHVLADEAGPVDLYQVAALRQADRPARLGKEPRNRRLARAWVAEEDEVLRRRDLRQPVLLALGLDLEKRDERPYLLLDRFETGQRIELRLERSERQRRLRLAECVRERLRQPLGRLAAGREAL